MGEEQSISRRFGRFGKYAHDLPELFMNAGHIDDVKKANLRRLTRPTASA